MDRYTYIQDNLLIDKCILAQNRRSLHILLNILNTKHKCAYQVFGTVAGEIMVFYNNINTKCFFGTSNFFLVSLVLFSFSILLWIFFVFVL